MDAAKSETLEEHQRVRAKMLGKIAGYYAQLNRNDRGGGQQGYLPGILGRSYRIDKRKYRGD